MSSYSFLAHTVTYGIALAVLRMYHVRLKQSGQGTRGHVQQLRIKEKVKQRVQDEVSVEQLDEKLTRDAFHAEVYRVATKRVKNLLQDENHFMHQQDGPTTVVQQVQPTKQGPARGAVFARLAQRARGSGRHVWQHFKQGLQFGACGKRIMACSTHQDILDKDCTTCNNENPKDRVQLLEHMISDTAGNGAYVAGH